MKLRHFTQLHSSLTKPVGGTVRIVPIHHDWEIHLLPSWPLYFSLCCLHTFSLKIKIHRWLKSKIIGGPGTWYGLYETYQPIHFLLMEARVISSGVCWICSVCSVLYQALVCIKIAFKAALPDQTVKGDRSKKPTPLCFDRQQDTGCTLQIGPDGLLKRTSHAIRYKL